MNLKKIVIFSVIVSLLLPVFTVRAQDNVSIYQDRINTSNSVFFMNSTNTGDYLKVNLSAGGEGIFGIYLFYQRPAETYVNFNRSIDPRIYEKAIMYDEGNNVQIEYTANDTKIYYIQIILISNGPDFYLIQSNRQLSRYYLPMIPGYQLEMLICSSVLSIGLIYIAVKRKLNSIKLI